MIQLVQSMVKAVRAQVRHLAVQLRSLALPREELHVWVRAYDIPCDLLQDLIVLQTLAKTRIPLSGWSYLDAGILNKSVLPSCVGRYAGGDLALKQGTQL